MMDLHFSRFSTLVTQATCYVVEGAKLTEGFTQMT